MYLERIEVVGFRGIGRLSLTLDDNTVLIGENAWGKSSLLDALTLLLSPGDELYHFVAHDFYFPEGEQHGREHNLQIVFTFCENEPGHHKTPRYRHLSPVWMKSDDRLHRIYLRFEGESDDEGCVSTWRTFLDEDGIPLELHDINRLVIELIRIHPVLRLRDARFIRRLQSSSFPEGVIQDEMADRLEKLTHELVKRPQNLTNKELSGGLEAMQQLLDHYFAEQGAQSQRSKGYTGIQRDRQVWESLEKLNQTIAASNNRSMRLILLGIFSTLLQAKGSVMIDPHARPLLLVEDPETRLHPIMMAVAWRLISQLPLQRITTTNSGDLLALVPAESICRLVRQSTRVASFRIGSRGMSPEDSRRIAFHIRFNRASSLFARCWLLVEGETEVWLLGEMAKQSGYHFEAEGIKIIEFAQSGLKPLIKFARRMGIEWHVLVDGDDAGKKYANTVRGIVDNNLELARDRLTALPALDMEFFMYREGFSNVYHDEASIPRNAQMPVRRVIQKAIHRSSKPDLAIAVAMDAMARGPDAIPLLIKNMFARVLWLARGKAD